MAPRRFYMKYLTEGTVWTTTGYCSDGATVSVVANGVK